MRCVIVISRQHTVNGTETSPVARDKLLLFHSTTVHAIYCRNSSCSRQIQWKSNPISLEIYFQWAFPAAPFVIIIIIITLSTIRLMIRLEWVFIYLRVHYVSINLRHQFSCRRSRQKKNVYKNVSTSALSAHDSYRDRRVFAEFDGTISLMELGEKKFRHCRVL